MSDSEVSDDSDQEEFSTCKENKSDIILACKKENLNSVKEILEAIPDYVNYQNKIGETPLFIACNLDNYTLATYLLEQGADINKQQKSGWTPLFACSVQGKINMVKFLIDAGVDVNCVDNDGYTPLCALSAMGRADIIQLLLDSGADTTIANQDGYTPYDIARDEKIRSIIKNTEISRLFRLSSNHVNLRNKSIEDTDLTLMISYWNTHSLLNLQSIDLSNNHIGDHGLSLLSVILATNPTLTQLNLSHNHYTDHGARKILSSLSSNTTLLSLKMDTLCLDFDLSGNINTTTNATPPPTDTTTTTSNNNNNTINKTLSMSSINNSDHNTSSTSMTTSFINEMEQNTVKWFITLESLQKCDKNDMKLLLMHRPALTTAVNDMGQTALCLCCIYGLVDMAKLLLEAGAAADTPNQFGVYPIHFAVESGHYGLMLLLKQFHANINILAKDGRTPLSIACSSNNIELVKYLVDILDADIYTASNESNDYLFATVPLPQPIKRSDINGSVVLPANFRRSLIFNSTAVPTMTNNRGSLLGMMDSHSLSLLEANKIINQDHMMAVDDANIPKFHVESKHTHITIDKYNKNTIAACTITYQPGSTTSTSSLFSNVYYSKFTDIQTSGNYFEITVSNLPPLGLEICVGLSTESAIPNFDRLPGWVAHSVGFHSQLGYCGTSAKLGVLAPRWCSGDVIGCGVSYDSASKFTSVYFTRNGVFLGTAFEIEEIEPLFPVLGFATTTTTSASSSSLSTSDETQIEVKIEYNFGLKAFNCQSPIKLSNKKTIEIIPNQFAVNQIAQNKLSSLTVFPQLPIFTAITFGFLEIVQYFIEKRMNINIRGHEGQSLLLVASKYSHIAIIGYLLENGADINITDNHSKSPLDYASSLHHDNNELLKVLRCAYFLSKHSIDNYRISTTDSNDNNNDEINNELEYSTCYIGDRRVKLIIDIFTTNKNITSLNLSNNQLTDTGLQTLIKGLLCANIISLNIINNNNISDRGYTFLLESLKEPNMQSLLILRTGKHGLDFDSVSTPPIWFIDPTYLLECDIDMLGLLLELRPQLFQAVDKHNRIAILNHSGEMSLINDIISKAFIYLSSLPHSNISSYIFEVQDTRSRTSSCDSEETYLSKSSNQECTNNNSDANNNHTHLNSKAKDVSELMNTVGLDSHSSDDDSSDSDSDDEDKRKNSTLNSSKNRVNSLSKRSRVDSIKINVDNLMLDAITLQKLAHQSQTNHQYKSMKKQSIYEIYNHAFLFALVARDEFADSVRDIISSFPQLLNAKDHLGRSLLGMSTLQCRQQILSLSLLYGRYQLTKSPISAEHKSGTCEVYLATDELSENKVSVALKFMKNKDQFLREISSRQDYTLSNDYILNIIRSHDETDTPFRSTSIISNHSNLKNHNFSDYPYCIVMPSAERNLYGILIHEHIAGKDWNQIKFICNQLVMALQHLHQQGLMHGDIKPLNVMRTEGRYKLIDLDACVPILPNYYAGSKYSSSYIPPEMIYIDDHLHHDDSTNALMEDLEEFPHSDVMIRCPQYEEAEGNHVDAANHHLPYTLVTASVSYDMWSLGVTLFQLFTGEPLFLANDEDDIDKETLLILAHWSDDFKRKKLAKITNNQARNLVSQLLNKDPFKRPTTDRVLSHPFMTGRKPVRMLGQNAAYDVFLSYRVSSDARHVEMIYDNLISKGIKVWLDRKCLLPGVPWEEGFCDGLMNSRAFIPLLSRNAINNPDPDCNKQNFSLLTESSSCDNVLLEYRLALELRERGLIEEIYPIFIGDRDGSNNCYNDYYRSNCHPQFSAQHPVVVLSVEEKLWEHLERQSLGAPLKEKQSVNDILAGITANQGGYICGDGELAFENLTMSIHSMITSDKNLLTSSSSIPLLTQTDLVKLTGSFSQRNLISPTGSNVGPGAGGGIKGAISALQSQLLLQKEELKRRDDLIESLRYENEILKSKIKGR